MDFPKAYPNEPPVLRIVSEFWHPNVYTDGKVCISILHAPGDDQYGYEQASERWLPIHTVQSILLSVISMLSTPNADSPANLDAAKEFREDPAAFKKKVRPSPFTLCKQAPRPPPRLFPPAQLERHLPRVVGRWGAACVGARTSRTEFRGRAHLGP